MINSNQEQVNRPKSNFFLICVLIAIVILIIVGGYLVYGERSSQNNQVTNTNTSDQINVTDDSRTADASTNNRATNPNNSIAAEDNRWQTYTNSVCGYAVEIPENWIASTDNRYWKYFLNTSQSKNVTAYMSQTHKNELDQANQNKTGLEAFPDMIINCYQQENDYLYDLWLPVKKDIDYLPNSIEESITKIFEMKQKEQADNIQGWLNSFISTEKINFGENLFTMIESGGFGQTCTAIIKNNKGNVLSIYIDAGSDRCEQFPKEQTNILLTLIFN